MSESRWRLHPGEYLGEISALCFLHLPSHFSSLPLLLAGTGSQIQVHSLDTGNIILTFQVFEGIRVHGISLQNCHQQSQCNALDFLVAVFGERRVKIFNLKIELNGHKPVLELACVISLPMFSHWVLDVSFLEEGANSSEDAYYLAIGCSDNSVHFWDIPGRNMHSHVKCSEKCLLYSMKMFGNKIESLRIASGTIFNVIVVWEVVPQAQFTTLLTSTGNPCRLRTHESLLVPAPIHRDVLINRLVGHEGSIFRIAWFSSGRKLVSVSDDRSARLWEVQAEKEGQNEVNRMTGCVLFGHNARIWDCCVFDSLIITAGEDCSCRVWNQNGQQVKEFKEHIGRGIWRCLSDPNSLLLVTAGFDSAIRIHQLARPVNGLEGGLDLRISSHTREVCAHPLPSHSRPDGLLDSKSEYIRCLHMASHESLYVATNNGYLYHVNLAELDDVIWTDLGHVSKDAPIICMDLLSTFHNPCGGREDWVALGDGKGNMNIIQAVVTPHSVEVQFRVSWQAERERHLLGCFWCRSLQERFVITADPGGRLKLWKLCYESKNSESHEAFLVGEFTSCFAKRIMCVDVSCDEEMLVCGDIRGNLLVFLLPKELLHGSSKHTEVKAFPVCYFKGAHGISTVNSVSIASLQSHQIQICSTGTDGCICYLQRNRDPPNLEFVGMKQLKELTAVQSVYDLSSGIYAVGFTSAYFVIWNISTTMKVLQIACGGWRRPNSYYIGENPEIMHCFSFVKDDVIHIHRNWLPQNYLQLYPQNIHLQFHGRELHSLVFISEQSLFTIDDNLGSVVESCWIITGCEDGTIRLTRYDPEMHKWLSSELLGVHVGGSAVRSICYVSNTHMFFPDSITVSDIHYVENKSRDTILLISVGAKRVVTAWKQTAGICDKKADDAGSKVGSENNMTRLCADAKQPFSFQWLSADVPVLGSACRTKKNICETLQDACGASFSSEMKNAELDLVPDSTCDDNFRHLAVTAFLVKENGSRVCVCFVVIASSDATVTLRALVLPFHLWYDIAELSSSSSPVLTVQHVVVPKVLHSEYQGQGNTQVGNFYLAVTGSTDGNIGIWDLTATVETFMVHVSILQSESCPGVQKRPQTGRGSQGGRWRRSSGDHYAKTKTVQCNNGQEEDAGNAKENHGFQSGDHADDHGALDSLKSRYVLREPTLVTALQIIENAHQSGVNCIYVSNINDASRHSDLTFSFYIISGGDDQAINCLRCDLRLSPFTEMYPDRTPGSECTSSPPTADDGHPFSQVRISHLSPTCVDKITSAHSSAVKGIWTDGIFVFSVGLDQRVRCWSLSHDKLTERAHLVVSVPEPEALDVKNSARNKYQIAVAGRGIQMIEFTPSNYDQ